MSELGSLIDQLASTTVEDVQEVSFAGRGLKLDSEEDAKEIVLAINNCSGMTALRLEGNTIGVQAAKAIAKALESQPNLKKALWKDMFTQRTEREIPDALNYLSCGITLANAQLSELDLSDNAFGPRGLKGIVNLLQSEPCYTLKELRLNNNGLGTSGAKMLASALSQCLVNSRKDGKPLKLKVFVCGRNRLENEGSLALSVFLKNLGTLEHIEIPQNGIYYEGIIGLSDALAANKNLKFLSLEDNSLTEKGAKAIAKHLPILSNLETINFGDCLLRTEGAITIAEALIENCPKLQELILGFNEIKTEGVYSIIEAVKNKDHLKKLILNGNQFGEETCQGIRENLKEIGKLEQLGSLSEDEESDEDYEQENGTSSEDEEKENNVHHTLSSGIHQSPMTKPSTAAEFISTPSAYELRRIYDAKVDLLSVLPEKPSLGDYLNLFSKIASVVELNDDKTEKAACYYADCVLKNAYTMFSNDDMWNFNNELVVHLGLIKGEHHKKTDVINVNGVFIILKHAAKQAYFHPSTKNMLQFFLSQPLKCGDVNMKLKLNLLQALYQ